MDRKIEYIKQKEEAGKWIRSLIKSEKVTIQTTEEYICKLCLDMYDIGYIDGFGHAKKEVKNN